MMKNLSSGINELIDGFLSDFRDTYNDSGLELYYLDYLNRAWMIVGAVFGVSFVVSSIIHIIVLHYHPLRVILSSIGIGLAATGFATMLVLYFPSYQANQRKSKLEENLVYSMSYMAVLSASGMPIERIMERIAEIEGDTPLKGIAKRFITNVKLYGYDILTALREMSDWSPSKTFSKIIYSIRNTVTTSGDLETILTYEVDRQLQAKREGLKKMLGSLVYIGELYVTMMVVAPILFILMLVVLSVIGGGFGGSPILQLTLLTFVGIPIMAASFIIILDMVLGEEE
jgi:flagellar protein FlaJ